MNTEELTIIANAISGITASGKDAFAWWIVARYGSGILENLIIIVGLLCVAVIVARVFIKLNPPEQTKEPDINEQFFNALRRVWMANGIDGVISENESVSLYAKLLTHMSKKQ